jgi:hypothetical protein
VRLTSSRTSVQTCGSCPPGGHRGSRRPDG